MTISELTKTMSFIEFAERYLETQVSSVPDLFHTLKEQRSRYHPEGWMMLECQMFDTTKFMQKVILPYGPNNTYKEAEPPYLSKRNGFKHFHCHRHSTSGESPGSLCRRCRGKGKPMLTQCDNCAKLIREIEHLKEELRKEKATCEKLDQYVREKNTYIERLETARAVSARKGKPAATSDQQIVDRIIKNSKERGFGTDIIPEDVFGKLMGRKGGDED